MKKYLVFLLIYTTSLFSIDISSENLIQLMDKGGEDRIKAIWLSYQTKQFFLLRKAAQYLIESENLLEHRMILRIFFLLDKDLETILPNWYTLIDQYINTKRDKEILKDCIKLARKWKEYRLIFSMIKLTKHPDYQIRREAIQLLNELNSDLVIPVIVKYLRSDNELLILYGLENSFLYPDKRFIPYLRECMNHPNKTIRIYAIRSLANYEEESFYILRNFELEKNEEVKEEMLKLIAEKKWHQYSYIANKSINDRNKNIRLASLMVAKSLKNHFFVDSISKQLLIENEEEVLKEGIQTLVELNKGDPYNSLAFLLNHPNKEIRIFSLKAIQKLNLKNYLNDLLNFITTEKESDVHLEFVYTICKLVDSTNYHNVIALIDNSYTTKIEKYLILSSLKPFVDIKTLNYLVKKNGIEIF